MSRTEAPADLSPTAGQCVSCGFLALRGLRERAVKRARGHYEVLPEERATPELAFRFTPDPFLGEIDGEPVGFVRAADLPREIKRITDSPEESVGKGEAARRVFNSHRHCKSWRVYSPGFDPKDTQIELKAEQVEQERKDFALRLSSLERRGKRLDRILTVIVALLTLFALGTFTPDSVGYKIVLPVLHRISPDSFPLPARNQNLERDGPSLQ